MRLGVPKEVKNHEYRVGLTPASVSELVRRGHEVWVEQNAGVGIGCDAAAYEKVGARIAANAQEVFDRSEMIVKVKEPQASEIAMLRPDHLLFTFLHLAPDPEQTSGLLKSGASAIAYETVVDDQGHLPLLTPMSEVAGRMSIQVGAHHLERAQGGVGILLGGVPGVSSGHVLVLGGGVVGYQAARKAVGLGAEVTIADISLPRLRELDQIFSGRVRLIYATQDALEKSLQSADLIIGAVLVTGGAAPKLIQREILPTMRPGSVIVDVAIDQGGSAETSKPTSHDHPTYEVDGVLHYCVTNMPGAVPRTSSYALNAATLPYVIMLAQHGLASSIRTHAGLRAGLNIHKGCVTHPVVAQALGYEAADPLELMA